ncbi:MAG TPA: hypothetical protein VNE17_13765 [Nitrolancea sp.]|nr:hypothetical protein [Nitrolancea sp.]
MLRFGLLVLFWVLFFLVVLIVEAVLLSATERDTRRAWLSRNVPAARDYGRIHAWWTGLSLWWRRFFIIAATGLALTYGLLLGATVTQALAGELHKFWAVLIGFGVACWIAMSLTLMRLDEDGPLASDEESPAT